MKEKFEYPDECLKLDSKVITNAKVGDSFAQFDIGNAYCSFISMNDNYEKAFYWFHLAAENGNMEAQFRLADLYALGRGVEQDSEKSYHWLIRSALQGFPKSLTRIHNLYHYEKSISCRGQLTSEEEKWTHPEFKKENNVRELYEYRKVQQESKLTNLQVYFKKLLNTYRDIVEDTQYKKDKKNAYLILGFLYQHGYGIKKIISRAITFYTLAAEKGDADAQYNLGYLYHHNTNIKWNYREALKWYTEATKLGSTSAQSCLAFLYTKGLGVDIDYQKAIQLYTQAAENRNVEAQIALARMARKGQGCDQDYLKAVKWYKRATLEGSTVAQNCLDTIFCCENNLGINISKNPEIESAEVYSKKGLCSKLYTDILNMPGSDNLEKLKKRAQHARYGDAGAMFEIGIKYYNGIEFSQDKETGFRWIIKAAKAGSIEARFTVAKMYKDGEYAEQNYYNSSIWYTKMAKKGNDEAQFELGMMYYHGLGVRKDPLEASKWFTHAINRNSKNSRAQCQLGILREKGEGLREDVEEAMELYLLSAKEKNTDAIYSIGRLHEKGNGVKQDLQKALKIFQKAAHAGNIDAQLRLADLYSDKDGPCYDISAALQFYEMASNQDHPEAKYKLAVIYHDGKSVGQNLIKAYRFFKESEKLGYRKAINLFNVPIDYFKTTEINYRQIAEMFILVSEKNIDSLEYNLGYYYEQTVSYGYNGYLYENFIDYPSAIKWYKKAAKKGVSQAQLKLAILYEEGKEIKSNIQTAIHYYKKAIKDMNPEAFYRLACVCIQHYGTPQALQKAFRLLKRASDMGHEGSRLILDLQYEESQNINYKEIKGMLKLAANSGDVISQYVLGMSYFNSEKTKENTQEAIKWLYLSSKGGYIYGSYKLGLIFEERIKKTENDYQQIIKLYQIAAEKGYKDAFYKLARIYHRGKGVLKDYLKAYNYYIKTSEQGCKLSQILIDVSKESIWKDRIIQLNGVLDLSSLEYDDFFQMWKYVAEEGDINVQYQLGCLYEEIDSDQDLIEAVKWYSKATEKNHEEATYRLGQLYENGKGIDQDFEKAIKLYEIAGERKCYKALYQLGTIYQSSENGKIDHKKALYYYKKAAKYGDNKSQFTLGKLYEEGEIFEKNMLEAIKWYKIAAFNENEDAQNRLDIIFGDAFDDHSFFVKWFHLLTKLIKPENRIQPLEHSFLGSIHYTLACLYYYGRGTEMSHEKAWDLFNKSITIYGNIQSQELSKVVYGNIDIAAKNSFLKKIEMLEKVVERLTIEEKYQLGLIYYKGVYTSSFNPEATDLCTIVYPDYVKSSRYFRMIVDWSPSSNAELCKEDVDKYYVDSSYYLGMLHYVTTNRKNIGLTSYDYFRNCMEIGHPEADFFLQEINKKEDEKFEAYKRVLEWYIANQSASNVLIYYNIAWMYSHGIGTEKHSQNAAKYYRIAADKGLPEAQYQLGYSYHKGIGVDLDYKKAIELYTQASEGNDINANYGLGYIYHKSQYRFKDIKKAIKHYKAAAERGDSNSQYYLGYIYLEGKGVEKDSNKAIEWLKKAVKQKHIRATNKLAGIYHNGDGVDRDYKKAFEYYNMSAAQEDGYSQYILGHYYENGLGIEKNYEKAIEWHTKAADLGRIPSVFSLGNMYAKGLGVEKDLEKAINYYKIAADCNNVPSKNELGYYYMNGLGVELNYNEAVKCYKEAANMNNDFANFILGNMYFEGRGLDKNFEKAFEHYEVAVDQGSIDAQYRLGYCYYHGYGAEKNELKGIELMTDAANRSDYSMMKAGEDQHSDSSKLQDFSKALECYQKVIEPDNKRYALRCIGLLYEHGDGVKKDYQTALNYYKTASDSECKQAYYDIAMLYYYGKGVKRNFAVALEWLQKLVDDPMLEDPFLFIRKESNSIFKPFAKKEKIYSMVPESALYGEAHHYLAKMYRNGLGTNKNHEKATFHLQLATSLSRDTVNYKMKVQSRYFCGLPFNFSKKRKNP